MKIKYVKHPVSKELKAELRSQGYTIIDVRFAPPEARDAMCDAEVQVSGDDLSTADNDVTADNDTVSSDASTDGGVTVDGYESLTEESLTDLSKEELSDIARNLGVQFHGSSGAEKIAKLIVESGLL